MLIIKMISSSDNLRQAAIEYRSPSAIEALARQMGVPVDDRRLEFAVELFSTTIVSACTDVAASDPDVPLGPDFVKDRLERALSDLAQSTADLQLP